MKPRKIKPSLLLYIMIILFCGCRNTADKTSERYFEKEIQRRLSYIYNLDGKDTLKKDAQVIHARIKDFILLSKDIENLGASVHLANRFFNEQSSRYGLNASDFREISTKDHIDVISEALLQNELNLLNQVIFKNDTSGLPLYTAQ